MKYLLDTNVLSELQKPKGNQEVKNCIQIIPLNNLYISTITIGEICYGVEKMPVCKKKHELLIWLYMDIPQWFENRIIPVGNELALEWGKMRARTKRTLPVADSQIAAAALLHNMTLVTRNTKNFEDIE